tara:strand:+ start:254 stop:475 length:222 start_codon:yes stop_codon:yes gene_type:complete
MTNKNVAYERAMMQVDELQNYIESLDSMPRILQKNLVTELDLIVVDLVQFKPSMEYALNQSSTVVEQTNEDLK